MKRWKIYLYSYELYNYNLIASIVFSKSCHLLVNYILSISTLSNVNFSVLTNLFNLLTLFHFLFQITLLFIKFQWTTLSFNWSMGSWRHEVMGTWGHWLHVFHWFHCFHCFNIFLYSFILSIQASMISFNFLTWIINFISFMTNYILCMEYQYVLLCNLFHYCSF